MKLIIAALGLIILVSLGCNRSHKSQSTEKQIEWAYQLIDEGYYSDSIDLFLNILQQEDTPTVRLGLASAYAARAGVQVHTYWDLVLPSVKSKPPTTFEGTENFKKVWNEKLEQLSPELKTQAAPMSEEVFKSYNQIEALKWRFQKIPIITSNEQNNDLVIARSLIADLPSKGARLYRSLLGLVLVRHELTRSSEMIQQSLMSTEGGPCTSSLKDWFHHLPTPLNLVSDILNDIKFAYPNKTAEIAPFEKDFEDFHGKILASLNVLDTTICSNY